MTTALYQCADFYQPVERPSAAHYNWHSRTGSQACVAAKREAAHYNAERKAGRPLPGWVPALNRDGYVCGPVEAAKQPGGGHYSWHNHRGEPACGKARAENAWRTAEKKAGERLPDFKLTVYRLGGYQCGEHPVSPGSGHCDWHYKQGTEPCEGALAELRWHRAQKKAASPILYWPQPPVETFYQCGLADEVEQPTCAHLAWHYRERTEPCDKAKVEKNWYYAEQRAGRPLPDWSPADILRECPPCGEAADAETAYTKHYYWHYDKGEPQCGRALAEMAWHGVEQRAGRPVPDYQYGQGIDWEAETKMYHIRFLDGSGDHYYGITAQTLEHRLAEHLAADTRVADKLRTGAAHRMDTLAVCADRRTAMELERQAIRQAGRSGRLLNIIHNQEGRG